MSRPIYCSPNPNAGRSRFGSLVRLLALTSIATLFLVAAHAQTPYTVNGNTVLDRIEEQSEWKTCGSCGNTGGTGAVATYYMSRGITSPTLDGSSTKFAIGGSYAYKNAYWYIGHSGSPSTPLKYLKYEFDLYVPKASATAPQAIEFECQQKAAGYVYNFAWQADYPAHQWRIFNYTAKRWEATKVAFNGFTPDKWHHIIAEYHTEGAKVVHDALTIDGVRYAIGIRHDAKPTTTGHYLTNGFQLDLNKYATDYKVYVDRMKVTYR